nr:hypothetical protein GCM10020063_098720 [Dactylosporangium thailandense]
MEHSRTFWGEAHLGRGHVRGVGRIWGARGAGTFRGAGRAEHLGRGVEGTFGARADVRMGRQAARALGACGAAGTRAGRGHELGCARRARVAARGGGRGLAVRASSGVHGGRGWRRGAVGAGWPWARARCARGARVAEVRGCWDAGWPWARARVRTAGAGGGAGRVRARGGAGGGGAGLLGRGLAVRTSWGAHGGRG